MSSYWPSSSNAAISVIWIHVQDGFFSSITAKKCRGSSNIATFPRMGTELPFSVMATEQPTSSSLTVNILMDIGVIVCVPLFELYCEWEILVRGGWCYGFFDCRDQSGSIHHWILIEIFDWVDQESLRQNDGAFLQENKRRRIPSVDAIDFA